ncbi:MAG: hypothetical protein AAF655_19280 [Bacteroidota bacterium]
MIFKKDKKQAFWKWFIKHKGEIEGFIRDENRNDFQIYHKLTKRMQQVNADLMPELTLEGETHVLIISCDGIPAGIPYVQELAASAPEIDNWVIKKFRQPSYTKKLEYEGFSLTVDDIKVQYELDEEREKVDIIFKMVGYQENDDRFKALGFLFMDHILGEFNVMTRVGYVDFDKAGEKEEGLVDLIELRKVIEDNLY